MATQILAAALLAMFFATAACASDAKDNAALRKKCAHLIKVKLKVADTGSVKDLAGVSGAVQMVDQCVSSGGKIN